jgi:hypothetical protein
MIFGANHQFKSTTKVLASNHSREYILILDRLSSPKRNAESDKNAEFRLKVT